AEHRARAEPHDRERARGDRRGVDATARRRLRRLFRTSRPLAVLAARPSRFAVLWRRRLVADLLLCPFDALDDGLGLRLLLRGDALHLHVLAKERDRLVELLELLVDDAEVEDEILRLRVAVARQLELVDGVRVLALVVP